MGQFSTAAMARRVDGPDFTRREMYCGAGSGLGVFIPYRRCAPHGRDSGEVRPRFRHNKGMPNFKQFV